MGIFETIDVSESKLPQEYVNHYVDEYIEVHKFNNVTKYKFDQTVKDIHKNYKCKSGYTKIIKYSKNCTNILKMKHHNVRSGGVKCEYNPKSKQMEWNENKCYIKECEKGFKLNSDRTECIQDYCYQ